MPGYNRLDLPAPYRALLTLDAAGFAWEWLRRNPAFRALFAGDAARRFARRALTASRRGGFAAVGRHPLAEVTAPWGLSFRG